MTSSTGRTGDQGISSHDLLFLCFRINVLECSALNTYNIGQLFRTFLTLSKIDLDMMARNERYLEMEYVYIILHTNLDH